MERQSLVSISEASQILGVSATALRQWTDNGDIRAFRTPGGHRRYSVAELKRFMTSHRKVTAIKDLIAELEGTVPLHGEIARAYFATFPVPHQLSEEWRECLADPGRRLLKLIVVYITEPSRREETIRLIREVSSNLGEALVKLKVPLTNSVEAFVQHRAPIVKAVTDLMKKRRAFSGRVIAAISMVAYIMDEALVSLIVAYQHQSLLQDDLKEGAAG